MQSSVDSNFLGYLLSSVDSSILWVFVAIYRHALSKVCDCFYLFYFYLSKTENHTHNQGIMAASTETKASPSDTEIELLIAQKIEKTFRM